MTYINDAGKEGGGEAEGNKVKGGLVYISFFCLRECPTGLAAQRVGASLWRLQHYQILRKR
jgi:hypothetical protein